MKKYCLEVAGQTFEIGEQLEDQPFRLFVYESLGIKKLTDWTNLFQIHLYQEKILLDRQLKVLPDKLQQFSYSDVLAYAGRGYQVLKNLDTRGFFVELYRPPTGRIFDNKGITLTQSQMMTIIECRPKGFTLVPHV